MIFSRTIKNIRSNKSAYEAKQKQDSVDSEHSAPSEHNSDQKMYSVPMITKKNIQKVIVVKKTATEQQRPGAVLNVQRPQASDWNHDLYKGSARPTRTFGVFLRNVHTKVTDADLTAIIGETDLLGIKISNKTCEMNFSTLEAAQKAIEHLNEKMLFGLKLKAIGSFEPLKVIKADQQITPANANGEKVVKVVRDEGSNLRMNQKDSIFNRIQFKK